jgi:Uma2 family endonuclease
MGMPAPVQRYYTVDEVLAFPDDGNKYELIYGELVVSPVPRLWHQRVVMRLGYSLYAYCEAQRVGDVFNVGADLTWGRRDVLTQPDVFVVAPGGLTSDKWSDVRDVSLAVEVLSPSTARYDRFGKRLVYRDQHVATYWIVDADDCNVEIWTPDAQFPAVERERLVWNPAGASEPLVIELAALFAKP